MDNLSFKEWMLCEMAQVRKIGPDEVRKKLRMGEFIGPLYHGTVADKRAMIEKEGFKVFKGPPRTGDTANGYKFEPYGHSDYPPPIHHLGFGVYFSTKEKIAKIFAGNQTKGSLKAYYAHAPRVETINYAAGHKMMKWWLDNGYNMKPYTAVANLHDDEKLAMWIKATDNLTRTLSSKFDAVHFAGKGYRGSLLDGDQVCIYNPDNLFEIDNNLAPGLDAGNGVFIHIGDRVKIKDLPFAASIGLLEAGGNHDVDYRVWGKVLGRYFNYFMTTDIKPPARKAIYEKYKNAFYQAALSEQNDPLFHHWKITYDGPEGSAAAYTERMLDKKLTHKLPSGLVERVLKPREHI